MRTTTRPGDEGQGSARPDRREPAPTSAARRPAQKPLLIALGVAVFMINLDARVVAPILPTVASEFQIGIARAGWLISAYMLPYGLFQLAYGPLADRVGKVRVAAWAMVAFSVGTALCGAFPSFGLIVALRALTGAAAAALIPLTIAYIGDTVPYARRQAALGMLMATAGAAQAFSTSAGGTIASLVSWRTVFPILGALAGAATLPLFLYQKREIRVRLASEAAPPTFRTALGAPRMKALLCLVATEGFLYMGGFSYLSGLLEQRFRLGAFAIGLVLGVLGLAQIASARLLPFLLARTSERALLLMGGTSMAVAYALSALAPHWSFVACACVLLGTGFTLCHSTLQTRATEAFPRARGTALALFAFSLFSGSALGTASIGYASDALGYGTTFALVSGLLLAFTAVVVRVLGPGATPRTSRPISGE